MTGLAARFDAWKAAMGALGRLACEFARAAPGQVAGALVLTWMQGFALAGTPYLLKHAIDAAVSRDGRALTSVYLLCGSLVGVLGLTNRARLVWMQSIAERSSHQMDRKIMELAMSAPTVEHLEDDAFRRELDMIRRERDCLASLLPTLSSALLLLIELFGAVVLLYSLHPGLAWMPLLAIAVVWCSDRAVGLEQRAEQETVGLVRTATRVHQLATSPSSGKEIRLFGLAPVLADIFSSRWQQRERVLVTAALRGAVLQALGWSTFALGCGAMLGLVVFGVASGRSPVSPGNVLMACSIALSFGPKVGMSVGILRRVHLTFMTMGRYVRVKAILHGRRACPAALRPPRSLRRGLCLRGVTFAYPGTERPVLEGIDVDLPRGSVVAIVGSNGAGKTTLIKLLCGVYEPTAGEVRVDDTPLTAFESDAFRSRISAMFQDACQFEFSAREAVGVGDLPNIDDHERVMRAVQRASAGELVTRLKDGLETELGVVSRRGTELSVGQWQRLAIGRALMREGPFLRVLDEPTASLDVHTEHAVLERYADTARERRSGAITILVSHRLSSVKLADLILVMDQGRIVQQGTHAELLRSEGPYASLFAIQAGAFA